MLNKIKMTERNERPVLLVGGGTGGHIMPLVAIAEELATAKKPFIFVGAKKSREQEIVTSHHWPFQSIEVGKWRRYSTISSWVNNLIDTFRVVIGFFQSLKLLINSQARLVFSKGGYVALPMIMAAQVLGRRVIIHESDAVMGLTNRLSRAQAKRILTAFEVSVYPQADSRYLQVGIPIRRALRQAAGLKAPKKSRLLIFVIAGIQGSVAINNLLKPIIKDLVKSYDLVHITGQGDFNTFKQLRQTLDQKYQSHYKPFAFVDRELPYYYQSSDIILSRASATTIVEGAVFSKAMYLIPLPTAASNHQVINARILEAAGAVVVKEQYQLSAQQLKVDLESLLTQPDTLRQLGSSLKKYFEEDQTLFKIMAEIG